MCFINREVHVLTILSNCKCVTIDVALIEANIRHFYGSDDVKYLVEVDIFSLLEDSDVQAGC